MTGEIDGQDFPALVDAIRQVHQHMAAQAGKAVNISLTLRNWAIGWYIREYEQKGADRATYGNQLVDRLAEALQESLDKCYTGRYLRLCRQFYETYPQIRKSVISNFVPPNKGKSPISALPALWVDRESRTAEAVSSSLVVPCSPRAWG